MFFHIEERRAWLRSHTHTIVFDRDPDFARFVRDTSGDIRRMLRIWLAESREEKPYLRAYLGTICFCATGPSRQEISRVFRRTSAFAPAAKEPARALRRRLAGALRAYFA